jgi:hypothetical protein
MVRGFGNLSWARRRTPTIGSRKAEKESASSDFGVQLHSQRANPRKQTETSIRIADAHRPFNILGVAPMRIPPVAPDLDVEGTDLMVSFRPDSPAHGREVADLVTAILLTF